MIAVQVRDLIQSRPDKMNKATVFEVPQMFLDVWTLDPGQAQHVHTHSREAKYYFVLEGEGTFHVAGEERLCSEGTAVFAPPGEEHGVRNDSRARLVLLVSMAPHPRLGQA